MIETKFAIAWDKIYQSAEQTPSLKFANLVEHVCQTSEITTQKQRTFLTNAEQKMVVKMTCPPPPNSDDRTKFFYHIVQGTIPVMLWTRCKGLANVTDWSTALDPLVTWETVRERPKLLEAIHHERMAAYSTAQPEAHLGHYLSVLYDNPDVRPEVVELRE
ncbi:MAG: hypothetical protein F6J87_24575 [Spirulina sp. SIO3F2]|nr:hypothetical protein [Spirulina sp. SIO3F2]